MKKFTYVALPLVAIFFTFTTQAFASLIRTPVDSSFVVLDDVNNMQWADLNRFVDMDFLEVEAEIANMNTIGFAGAMDWHLASGDEILLSIIGADDTITAGELRNFDPTINDDDTFLVAPDIAMLLDVYSGRFNGVNPSVSDPHHMNLNLFHGADVPDSTEAFKIAWYPWAATYDNWSGEGITGAWVVTSAPVPEPATMLLLGTGLVGVAGAARRRKKKNQA